MSHTPLLAEFKQSQHRKGWSEKEDKALAWAWKSGASDEEMAQYFGRTEQAIAQHASVIGLGRRGKAQVVKVPDESTKAENEALKAENGNLKDTILHLAEVFEGVSQHIKTHLK